MTVQITNSFENSPCQLSSAKLIPFLKLVTCFQLRDVLIIQPATISNRFSLYRDFSSVM